MGTANGAANADNRDIESVDAFTSWNDINMAQIKRAGFERREQRDKLCLGV